MHQARPSRERESRSTRRVELYLRRQDGREIKTLLTNISARGCRLRLREALAVGELIRLEVPRLGSVAGAVRWRLDGNAGIEFIAQSDVWEEVAAGSSRAMPGEYRSARTSARVMANKLRTGLARTCK